MIQAAVASCFRHPLGPARAESRISRSLLSVGCWYPLSWQSVCLSVLKLSQRLSPLSLPQWSSDSVFKAISHAKLTCRPAFPPTVKAKFKVFFYYSVSVFWPPFGGHFAPERESITQFECSVCVRVCVSERERARACARVEDGGLSSRHTPIKLKAGV